jgi:hypothetical protein
MSHPLNSPKPCNPFPAPTNRGEVQLTLMMLLVFMDHGTLRGEEQSAPVDGFSNYYSSEGTFDWSKSCRIVIDLPLPGTQLPAPASLKFIFEKDQEKLPVFQTYSRGTAFDLGFHTATSPFAYYQSGASTSVVGAVATVSFDAFQLQPAVGGSGHLNFEIYGDCNRCGTGEARPPDHDHTTWRVFGTIELVSDSSNKVLTCRLINVGSEEPQKHLPSRDPQYYPRRMVPRQDFDKSSNITLPAQAQCGGSVACSCSPLKPRRRSCRCRR